MSNLQNPNHPPEPQEGPFARNEYFMSQRTMGDGAIANLPAHRREQLGCYRASLLFHQNLQLQEPAPTDEQALDLSESDALPSGPGVPRDLNWSPLGPAAALNGQAATTPPVSGRIEAIAASADGTRVYVGSANGGIWRSDDGGQHWQPTMNAFNLQPNALQADSLSVGGLVMSPKNKNVVVVGTGEGGSANFNSESSASGEGYFGVGPAVSDDGGLTWMTEKLQNPPANAGVAFFPMAMDPMNPERVIAPTSNGLYARESRNLASFPANGFQPQSYLYRYKPATGETFVGYWKQALDGLQKADFFGANAGLKDFDTLTPVTIEGVPFFFFYNSANGNYLFSKFNGDGTRVQVSNGAWPTGLSLMPFLLNGLPYLARYDKATGNASVLILKADGTFSTAQTALTWKTNWTLLPLVVAGFGYFLGYNAADGSLTMMQWQSNGTATQVWAFPAGTWPKDATLTGFELNDTQYLVRYVPADGSFSVDRVQENLFLVSVTCANTQSRQVWGKNRVLTSLVFKDKPYLLSYAPGSGFAQLFGWTDLATPEKKWLVKWDDGLLLMPFQMGFEWLQRTAPLKAASDPASAVVVASTGLANTFFAAFQNGPVFKSTDNGANWVQIGGSQAFTGRISLAVQASNPNLLYAIDSLANVFRLDTTDIAHLWRPITGTPTQDVLLRGQGNYDLVIAVLPSDPDVFFLGGATVLSGAEWSGAIYRGKVIDDAGTLKIAGPGNKMTYIGGSSHADIHAFTFPSGGNSMWVGSDGGAFYAADSMGVDPNALFESRNAGLNTMTLERLGQHPTQDAVLFVGSQDNGALRFLGDPAWTVVSKGDAGAVVVNPGNPQQVITSYVNNSLYYSSSGGNPDTFNTARNVPIVGNQVLFYAPLVGTPTTSGQPNYLLFGANRPYISTDFAATWQSLPANDSTDDLPSLVRAMRFSATSTIFYVATLQGQVYRFTKKTLVFSWTKEQIDNTGNAGGLPSQAPITSIAVVPGDNSSLYVCYGGQMAASGWRRVWKYDGTAKTWTSKSGPANGDPQALLNIQYNAITFGASATEIYVAGDLGVWRTTDGGDHWQPMGNGLPEAAVLDLAYFPAATAAPTQPALLRASTYGRGVYEFILSRKTKFRKDVQVYLRDTLLDRGLYPTVDGLTSPVDPTKKVSHRDSPDIKVTQANNLGVFPNGPQITYVTYSDKVQDISQSLVKQTSTRFYVQVHQRGVADAVNTSVRILLSTQFSNTAATTPPTSTVPNPSPTPPVLPSNLVVLLEKGEPVPAPVSGKGWFDLGTQNIENLLAGVPKVVSIEVDVTKLPKGGVYCLLAIVYQARDPFDNLETDADMLTVADEKVAMKYLWVT